MLMAFAMYMWKKVADLDMAKWIILDAKSDYPAARNAIETLLLHEIHNEDWWPWWTYFGITSSRCYIVWWPKGCWYTKITKDMEVLTQIVS